MTGPTRFKNDARSSREGYLMGLGSDEVPEPEALLRAAQRLRISAASMAAASAGIAAAAMTSAVSFGHASSAAAGPGKILGTVGVMTLIKGTLVGLSLGLAVVIAAPHVISSGRRNVKHPVAVAVIANPLQLPKTEPSAIEALAPISRAKTQEVLDLQPRRVVAGGGVAAAASAAPRLAAREPNAEQPRLDVDALQEDSSRRIQHADAETTSATPSATAVAPLVPASPAPIEAQSTASRTMAKSDPRLILEVTSLDQVRLLLRRGNPAGALSHFEAFERQTGYRLLRREALLIEVDVLTVLGRRKDAAVSAREVLRLGISAAERSRLELLLRQEP